MKSKATMTGHMIGNFWAVVVVNGDVLGQPYLGQGTFGFDSQKKKFIGTWADSMSDFLWRYDGVVEGDKLVLNSEGPIPGEPGKMIKSRDTWEFKGKDQVILTGEVQGPDGKMVPMMRATCTRKVSRASKRVVRVRIHRCPRMAAMRLLRPQRVTEQLE